MRGHPLALASENESLHSGTAPVRPSALRQCALQEVFTVLRESREIPVLRGGMSVAVVDLVCSDQLS